MSYAPCLNPNCKSHGQPHPNCRCGQGMAEGGEVSSFCSSNRPHSNGCEYYADGGTVGQIDFSPDSSSETAQAAPIDFALDDQSAAKEAKYGSLGQQALTAAEGLGKGLAGPAATLAERGLGVKGQDITGRAEANPITHNVSEAVGMVAPAVLTEGASSLTQAGLLGTAGKAVTKGLGLQGAKAVAVKLGVENSLYALGDELSKTISGNPNSIQTAAAHVGLSGLLGGVVGLPLGAASSLWTNKIAPKAEPFVQDFIAGLKGEAAEVPFSPSVDQPIKNFYRPGAPLFSKIPAPETAGFKAGAKAADLLTTAVSDAMASSLGAEAGHVLGKLTGFPGLGYVGTYLGHKNVTPLIKQYLPTIAKALLENEGSAAGLKAAFDSINAVAKGDSALTQAARGLFESGSSSTFNELKSDNDHLLELDKHVNDLGQDPSGLMDVGGQMGYYMPAHQTALASTAQNAVNYLNSQRPQPVKPGVLNPIIEPSHTDIAAYYRTLGIAEQPLIVLKHVKDGTLHPKDMQDLNVLYPDLVPNITQKVNNHLIDHVSKGNSVPFKMRWGLSMLMGQDLDSIFSAQSIQAAQATHVLGQQPPQQAQQASSKPKGNKDKLGKTVELAQTPSESRVKALSKA